MIASKKLQAAATTVLDAMTPAERGSCVLDERFVVARVESLLSKRVSMPERKWLVSLMYCAVGCTTERVAI